MNIILSNKLELILIPIGRSSLYSSFVRLKVRRCSPSILSMKSSKLKSPVLWLSSCCPFIYNLLSFMEDSRKMPIMQKAIAFAIASGVSPEKGLITAVVGGFLVSFLGGSRVQTPSPPPPPLLDPRTPQNQRLSQACDHLGMK